MVACYKRVAAVTIKAIYSPGETTQPTVVLACVYYSPAHAVYPS